MKREIRMFWAWSRSEGGCNACAFPPAKIGGRENVPILVIELRNLLFRLCKKCVGLVVADLAQANTIQVGGFKIPVLVSDAVPKGTLGMFTLDDDGEIKSAALIENIGEDETNG